MLVDPIADMLTRIRNAQAVLSPEVDAPFSKIKYQIAKILEREGLIGEVKKAGRGLDRKITLVLKYKEKMPAIVGLRKISKPGQRIYKSRGEIRLVRGGFGVGIISTSQGLMTDKEARKSKLGGEVMVEIW